MKFTLLVDRIDGVESKNTDVWLDEIDGKQLIWKLISDKTIKSVTLVRRDFLKELLEKTR